METNEEKMKRLEYYQELFLPIFEGSYPFYSLVMSKQLTKQEVEEIFALCQLLSDNLIEQKEEGFVTFAPLLTHFVGMLNYKLDPHATIEALYKQKLYLPLMIELKKLLTI